VNSTMSMLTFTVSTVISTLSIVTFTVSTMSSWLIQ
jgi:hypothetical protein